MQHLELIGKEPFTSGYLYFGDLYFMARTALSFKIDEASSNYWRTKDPKFKKEWYRLINLFCKLIQKKPMRKSESKLKRLK